jgi:hypothetical protein
MEASFEIYFVSFGQSGIDLSDQMVALTRLQKHWRASRFLPSVGCVLQLQLPWMAQQRQACC